jgi:hypothetical protein
MYRIKVLFVAHRNVHSGGFSMLVNYFSLFTGVYSVLN